MVLWISALQRTSGTEEAKVAAYKKKLEGYFVFCSVTGEQIPLNNLKYWNVDRNEMYKDCETGLTRYGA